ncbi:PilX N-terminal domain-containing pilus assembly protein, partial [Ralstonia wenshanensis]
MLVNLIWRRSAQRGVALPVALIFLVLLTLLGLALVNGSVMQEMMFGNSKDTKL